MATKLSGTYRYNGPLDIFYESGKVYNLSVEQSFFFHRIRIQAKRSHDGVIWSSRRIYNSEREFRADWTQVYVPARNDRGQFMRKVQ